MQANVLIANNLSAATQGNRLALQLLYKGILEGPLYVPNRAQSLPLTNLANYPNDLVSMLAVQSKEDTLVPAFSSPLEIKDWCGQELSYRTYSGLALFALIPEGWWIAINPGSSCEKELSPWEISVLRGGEAGIEEVIEEVLSGQDMFKPLAVSLPALDEFPELRRELITYAEKTPAITTIFLLREEGSNADGEKSERLLIGVELNAKAGKESTRIESELQAIARRGLIGELPAQVCVSDGSPSVMHGIFQQQDAIYRRNESSSIFQRLRSLFVS